MVPRMMTRIPTQPTDDVTIWMMSPERVAWASSTPDRPMTYSPTVMPMTVCLTASAALRLKRVMSGVMTAPTMNPPATRVVPSSSDSGGPAGAELTNVPMLCLVSSLMIDQPTRIRNAGTVMLATHCMEWNPNRTTRVTARPKISDQTQTGNTPSRAASPCADTADWIPNHPMRLMPIASPISDEPA